MTVISKAEYERTKEIERNPYIIQCMECGEYFNSEFEGVEDREGREFCREACKEHFKEK